MMSEAEDTGKKVCDAMEGEHAKSAEYFHFGKFTNIGSRTPCEWSGTTRMSCPGTGSSHGTYRVSHCERPGKMCT